MLASLVSSLVSGFALSRSFFLLDERPWVPLVIPFERVDVAIDDIFIASQKLMFGVIGVIGVIGSCYVMQYNIYLICKL